MADDVSRCVHGGGHSWYRWRQIHCPFDLIPEHGFLYIRTCSIMGCAAVERAKDLEPVGKTEIYFDPKEILG